MIPCGTDTEVHSETSLRDTEGWIASLGHVAGHYGIPYSAQSARNSIAWACDRPRAEQLILLARHLGLRIRLHAPDEIELTSWRLPVVCEFSDGGVGVIVSRDKSDMVNVVLAGERDATIFAASKLKPLIS